MVALPKKDGTIHRVDAKETTGYGRTYLGMSSIGSTCYRKLWYGFHWVSKTTINARSQRIFNIGHMFEELAVKDLKDAGCFVFRVDKDGNQVEITGKIGEEQEEMVGFAGHAKGHNDGRILGLAEMPDVECLAEFKTMKDDKWQAFRKKGIQESNYVYFCQMQKYMGKMGLSMAYILAINKNTAEYWWEFVPYDHEIFNELERKEKIIIIADEPPERAYSSDNYNCNFCNHYTKCHSRDEPEKNCRTCDYSDIEGDGIWSCSNPVDPCVLSKKDQEDGCSHWEKGWGL